MYAKLVFRNAKRSVKDYLIYIVTMTICVTLFYSFLSISSRYYQPDIGSEYNFTILSDGMKAAICVITLFLLFLIRFVNHYMLRRKQKEFAVQSIMGMEQKTVGRLFFAETFMMGILSIAIGIFLGVFCSQFITAMLLTTYGKSYELSWTLFPDTVLLTIGFFIFSFLIVGIFNTRTIRKTKIIDMLAAEKENDPELKKSRWIAAVVLLFEGFTVWMLLTGVQKIVFYYDDRFAIPAKLMFWGNILFPAITLLWSGFWLIRKRKTGVSTLLPGLLVCTVLNTVMAASVPALTSRYYLALGAGAINQYLLFLLIDLLFFIGFGGPGGTASQVAGTGQHTGRIAGVGPIQKIGRENRISKSAFFISKAGKIVRSQLAGIQRKMYKIVPAERQKRFNERITKNRCKPSKTAYSGHFWHPRLGSNQWPVA